MDIKQAGKLLKAYIEPLNDSWCVYAYSTKYKRNVNTHMCPTKQEAITSRNSMNQR
jgi:hypothetical protein